MGDFSKARPDGVPGRYPDARSVSLRLSENSSFGSSASGLMRRDSPDANRSTRMFVPWTKPGLEAT